jgi:hypothetical protein
MFYLYVGDSHAVYKQALEAGATSIHPPEWMAYGDYVAAFTDPSGNKWFAADYGIESYPDAGITPGKAHELQGLPDHSHEPVNIRGFPARTGPSVPGWDGLHIR